MPYDVSLITLRPATTSKALAPLEQWLASSGGRLLACWSSELGPLNQVLVIRAFEDEASISAERDAVVQSENPYGIGDFVTAASSDTYALFPFLEAIQPGSYGPFFEVRTYVLKPNGLASTIELWRKAVPGRVALSPLLTAMYSTTGPLHRFMHIWPYRSLDDRQRLRAQAVEAGVWPPPGGPDRLLAQQADIYVPAPFSPIR